MSITARIASGSLSRRFQIIAMVVWVVLPVLVLVGLAAHALYGNHNNMAGLFPPRQKQDPNSIGGRIAIGYWEELPGQTPEDFIRTNWKDDEKQMVIQYLESTTSNDDEEEDEEEDNAQQDAQQKQHPTILKRWRGLAACRICDQIVGSTCHGDDKFNWPEGYSHYIQEHNVQPPRKFIQHVKSRSVQNEL